MPGSRKLKESKGRFLKLLLGIMMLALGKLLLVMPDRLNTQITAAALLLTSLVSAFLAARLTNMVKAFRSK